MKNWTAQRMKALRRMWTEGRSSNEIAEAFGDVTRNAVMGKVDRMGLLGNALHNISWRRAPRSVKSGSAVLDLTVEPLIAVPVVLDGVVDASSVVSTSDLPVDAPAFLDVLDEAAAASLRKPRRTAADIARIVKASRPVVSARAHVDRASRPWRTSAAPAVSPEASEPAIFSMPPKGLMQRVRAASGGIGDADHPLAVGFVKEMGAGSYDPSRRAHQAALVAIATVLGRGDPRRILVPHMPEPHVLQMMRGLAEKAIVVAGKPPERWFDVDTGDAAFFEDVIAVEGPLKDAGSGFRRSA